MIPADKAVFGVLEVEILWLSRIQSLSAPILLYSLRIQLSVVTVPPKP
jgi:hypothetical protein